MGEASQPVPPTGFQAELGRLLAASRSEGSDLAGRAAIVAEPHCRRLQAAGQRTAAVSAAGVSVSATSSPKVPVCVPSSLESA